MKIRTSYVANSSSSSCIVSTDDNKYGIIFGGNMKILTFKEYFEKFGDYDIPLNLGFSSYYYSIDNKDQNLSIKMVSDKEYIKLFKHSIKNIVPISAEKDCIKFNILYSQLSEYTKKLTSKNNGRLTRDIYSDPLYSFVMESQDIFFNKVKRTIYNVLKKEYSSMMFCYKEVEDNTLVYDTYYDEPEDEYIEKYDDNGKKISKRKIKNLAKINNTRLINNIYTSNEVNDLYEDRYSMNEEQLVIKKMEYIDNKLGLKFKRVFCNH